MARIIKTRTNRRDGIYHRGSTTRPAIPPFSTWRRRRNCAIAEEWMYRGQIWWWHDDLKHAVAYRAISLLLVVRRAGKPIGDVFYLHSRLLERAAF